MRQFIEKKNPNIYATLVIHHGTLLEIVAKCNLVGDVMQALAKPAGIRAVVSLISGQRISGRRCRDGVARPAGRTNAYQ